MSEGHIHHWIPYFYKISYVGDGKNVNYMLASVYCHGCKAVETIESASSE